jgi:1-acyl-sn-glycerol-3-phosphate acyltransferase
MEAKKFIDIRKLIGSKNPTLLRWLPNFVIKYLERILHQDEINQFLIDHPTQKNEEFCRAAIRFFNITIEIEGLENIPQSGGVTLAMNHPLGGMDAIALVDAISSKRTDLKFIVNDLLLNLEGMKGMFVGVNKHGKTNESIHQKIDELFHSDKAVCIFPAGMVSRKQKGLVRDLEWKKTFVMLSKRANHPIVPIYIDGKLSNFFYRLSNFRKFIGIKANIEMLYLSDELFKQKNVTMKFRVGKPITPEMLDESKSHREWAQWIRNSVYELEKETKK